MLAFPSMFRKCRSFINKTIVQKFSCDSESTYLTSLNQYNRRTGRGYANDLTHRDLPRAVLACKKGFTRAETRLVGVDSGLEKIKLMLDVGKKAKPRKLNEAKRNRLGRMFLEYIFQILCESDRFCGVKGLELYKVDVGPTYKVMDVYWLAKGDEYDRVTEAVLKNSEEFVRRKLSESLGNRNVPRIIFVAERKHLVEQAMNHLFARADYGMQYRAISHTGEVLGSMAEV